MSKRCSAQHCFNSNLYTKNISYFSFPKHKKFADQWADLAGRSDLKKKPLLRVVKYFLCSEHFTANCFVDIETKQKLKRDLPHSIALPSIFKNNLQETMHISNPKQTMEVHNIILLDSVEDFGRKLCENAISDEIASDSLSGDGESANEFEKINKEPLVTKVEVLENVEILKEVEYPCHEDYGDLDEILLDIATVKPLPKQCRLCFKELAGDEDTTQFGESLHLREFITRVMSDKITVGDEFSQIVCKNCENNSLLCLIIIQQMDGTQDKIISSAK
ncbi:uncharacterized protein LOC129915458 [Episyrphus balteatus]|uniref:uncharacterized protein LOC129915458 n=1 Tax=Episyrphus balteatus TaxID=286459 RepID=UPI0024860DF2|nr:uncharacterized protein LOC129915458 [Episyrphus balteatus]